MSHEALLEAGVKSKQDVEMDVNVESLRKIEEMGIRSSWHRCHECQAPRSLLLAHG